MASKFELNTLAFQCSRIKSSVAITVKTVYLPGGAGLPLSSGPG